jgi:hypothetical protein
MRVQSSLTQKRQLFRDFAKLARRLQYPKQPSGNASAGRADAAPDLASVRPHPASLGRARTAIRFRRP